MICGMISCLRVDSLSAGNESKTFFETLVFHNINFSSNDRSFDVAVIIFSDGPWRLELNCSVYQTSQKETELSPTNRHLEEKIQSFLWVSMKEITWVFKCTMRFNTFPFESHHTSVWYSRHSYSESMADSIWKRFVCLLLTSRFALLLLLWVLVLCWCCIPWEWNRGTAEWRPREKSHTQKIRDGKKKWNQGKNKGQGWEPYIYS